jgi:hypothetical protein
MSSSTSLDASLTRPVSGIRSFFVDLKVSTQQTIASTYNSIQAKMKVLTLNFLTCAVKTCKSSSDSFPLHPKDAELASDDVEVNPQLLVNLLPRIDWNALRTTSTEASLIFMSALYCTLVFASASHLLHIHIPSHLIIIPC